MVKKVDNKMSSFNNARKDLEECSKKKGCEKIISQDDVRKSISKNFRQLIKCNKKKTQPQVRECISKIMNNKKNIIFKQKTLEKQKCLNNKCKNEVDKTIFEAEQYFKK